MNRVALITLLVMDCVSQAAAQSGTLNAGDRTFLMRDSRGAAYELASAKLAVQKASRNDIKGYAEKLVKDHEDYNTALENLGKQDGITLPTEPDAADKAHMAALQKQTGKAFDKLYVKEALRINAEDKRDAEKEKAATKSEAVKAFIAKFADMDAEHEKLAKQLAKSPG